MGERASDGSADRAADEVEKSCPQCGQIAGFRGRIVGGRGLDIPMTGSLDDADTAAAVLGFARRRRAVADRAEAELLQAAVAWAAMHPAESIEDAASHYERSFGDEPIPLAGPGTPLVAEFSIAEFAAAVGLPTEVGKSYVGEALELRHRLPQVWSRVVAGRLVAWRARRIAKATMSLSVEAVAYVDRHVAPVALQDPGRRDRPDHRDRDRPVHARGDRTPPPGSVRWPVLQRRQARVRARRHHRCVGHPGCGRRPRPERSRGGRCRSAQGPRVDRVARRPSLPSSRGAGPPAAGVRPQPSRQ